MDKAQYVVDKDTLATDGQNLHRKGLGFSTMGDAGFEPATPSL